ncbi:Endonuclease/exonuclease/phosphatase [Zychaea mexicana]|uniref:Endonuclease/exonuclease/phosphatase n=1 Tax=Zychaea mexicana TaxID=64656 RepID=UPI0022FDE6F2|nr:Endonuclease/exonuclease/phosphatase [Zychaea mexicana]KAI9490143.1 Endonuclease/exonuclease/phosphatase [Zychaea mexicana]
MASDLTAQLAGNSTHLARQLTYAQISRQSASPHHHARTAAAMARNAPVASTVTITDPNNPSKSFNGLMKGGIVKHDEDSGRGNKLPTHNNNNNSNGLQQATLVPQTWTTLDLGGMGLKNLSPALCNYTFLTTLYLNYNNLTHLPSSISNLVSLKTLDASGNKLTSIPPEMGLLINLRELLLFDNNITDLPNEMGSLYQLETLGLEGNPVQPEIKNILMKDGSAAVILSLRENAPVGMPPPQREWITVESSSSEEDGGKFISYTFSVFCFNILCQKYATAQAYGYTPSWALSWDYRKELILSEIQSRNADIICLQELAYNQYEEYFRHEFRERAGYDSVFYPKSRAKTMSDKERGEVDGCATFFKSSKFELIEVSLLEYNQKALQRADFKKCPDIYNRVMTKDNIAVLTMLENKDTLARVLVANSHIHWDPSFADVKLVQVGMLMDEIDKFATKHLKPPTSSPTGVVYPNTSKLPTIIAGDFNSSPDSGVYEFLSKGAVKQNHADFGEYLYGDYTTDGLSHKLSLKSSYAQIGELPFTNYIADFEGVLDYVWHSTNTLDVLSLLGPIDKDYLSKVVGFPNAHFPSE